MIVMAMREEKREISLTFLFQSAARGHYSTACVEEEHVITTAHFNAHGVSAKLAKQRTRDGQTATDTPKLGLKAVCRHCNANHLRRFKGTLAPLIILTLLYMILIYAPFQGGPHLIAN